jgi:serine carboxypeptidase
VRFGPFAHEHGRKKDLINSHRFGGEAVSLALDHPQSSLFAASPYAPLVVNGDNSHGRVREFGNLSFAVVHEAGHLVPTYKPDVSLELFRRAVRGKDLATGIREGGGELVGGLPFQPDPPFEGNSRGNKGGEHGVEDSNERGGSG